MTSPLLTASRIAKSFPGVQALKGVHFDLLPGEVHALVGENGAGKSTFMQILAGAVQPDAGEVRIDGELVRLGSQQEAQRRGIAMVFQERSLFPDLSIAENVFATQPLHTPRGLLDWARMRSRSSELLQSLGLDLDVRTVLRRLSPMHQQLVEIAKALAQKARILILDEPTASLSRSESDALFAVIENLRDRHVGIIYISHHLDEVLRIANRVTTFRDGTHQGTLAGKDVSTADLIPLMVGREVDLHVNTGDEGFDHAPVALEVDGLSDAGFVRDVSFRVRAGEIVALAGLAGAGRTETALAIFGAARRRAGRVRVFGKTVDPVTPADAILAGLGYVSEDRRDLGLFLQMGTAANLMAVRIEHFGRWWLSLVQAYASGRHFQDALRIATPTLDTPVGRLSGGNQQKVALSKWLRLKPRVLIADEPTRGIDVAAKAEVHRILYSYAREGNGVLLISSDLPEVLALADRVVVMRQGRVECELKRSEATEEEIMRRAATDR